MTPERIIELLEAVLHEVSVLRQNLSSDALLHLAVMQRYKLADSPAQLVVALVKRPILTHEIANAILYSLRPDDAVANRSNNTITVFIMQLRRKLLRDGIEVKNMHAVGWYVGEDQRKKLVELLERGQQ